MKREALDAVPCCHAGTDAGGGKRQHGGVARQVQRDGAGHRHPSRRSGRGHVGSTERLAVERSPGSPTPVDLAGRLVAAVVAA